MVVYILWCIFYWSVGLRKGCGQRLTIPDLVGQSALLSNKSRGLLLRNSPIRGRKKETCSDMSICRRSSLRNKGLEWIHVDLCWGLKTKFLYTIKSWVWIWIYNDNLIDKSCNKLLPAMHLSVMEPVSEWKISGSFIFKIHCMTPVPGLQLIHWRTYLNLTNTDWIQ